MKKGLKMEQYYQKSQNKRKISKLGLLVSGLSGYFICKLSHQCAKSDESAQSKKEINLVTVLQEWYADCQNSSVIQGYSIMCQSLLAQVMNAHVINYLLNHRDLDESVAMQFEQQLDALIQQLLSYEIVSPGEERATWCMDFVQNLKTGAFNYKYTDQTLQFGSYSATQLEEEIKNRRG